MGPSPTGLTPLLLFPLIRHFSNALSPVLLKTPLTPNQITALSTVLGLITAACFAWGNETVRQTGAALFVLSYILDNCDGDIARAKSLSSDFGAHFDTMSDWIVHALFFLGLGYGVTSQGGSAWWLGLGMTAALGSTINYFIGAFHPGPDTPASAPATVLPQGLTQTVLYFFREIFRADFCFIVLALSFFDATWILLPLSAIGAQVYWVTGFIPGARRFHV